MRVLIWTQFFWPENFFINSLSRDLARELGNVTVLTGKPNYPQGRFFNGYRGFGFEKESYFDCNVYRVPVIARGNKSLTGLLLSYLSFIFSGYFFAPFLLKNEKFDHIFVFATSPLLQALPAVYIAWRKNAKLVIWVQDIWPDVLTSVGFANRKWLIKLVGLFVNYIYYNSSLILIQSEGFRGSIEARVRDKNKIHYLANSVEILHPNSAPKQLPFGLLNELSKQFSVVFAGNIGRAQSCETIVEAAKLLQSNCDIKIFLIGDGSRSSFIRDMIERYKLTNIVMTGFIHPALMSSVYSASSALLLTLSDNFALSSTVPSKLQSYLHAGKPIIASINGDAAEIINSANAGYVCPAENPDQLASLISNLHSMPPSNRAVLGVNAQKYFDSHFGVSATTARLIEYLSNL